jgi:pyrroline-5-carboxylate reductase
MACPTVAIVGVGAMGEALVAGLLRAGWEPADLSLGVRRVERGEELAARYGCTWSLDPKQIVQGRDVVVVAVKPQSVPHLLEQLIDTVESSQTVISLVAGVATDLYEEALGDVPVVRAMPNTPALVDEGITGIAPGRFAGERSMEQADLVLQAVGGVIHMSEHHLDAVTAVSGTGPAYAFLLAEALTEAALREGLSREVAERLVNQTIKGAGALLVETGKGPFELRAQVTSPGGTTAAAMHILEGRGFRALVEDAVAAAAQRSRELGKAARQGDR